MKQLRLTTTKPYSMIGSVLGSSENPELLVDEEGEVNEPSEPLEGKSAYIHGAAEDLAGFDIPKFLSGDLDQLAAPVEEQDIVLVLPWKEIRCVSKLHKDTNNYHIVLKPLFENPPEGMELVLSANINGSLCDVYKDYKKGIITVKMGDRPNDKASCKIGVKAPDDFWKAVLETLATNQMALKNI